MVHIERDLVRHHSERDSAATGISETSASDEDRLESLRDLHETEWNQERESVCVCVGGVVASLIGITGFLLRMNTRVSSPAELTSY